MFTSVLPRAELTCALSGCMYTLKYHMVVPLEALHQDIVYLRCRLPEDARLVINTTIFHQLLLSLTLVSLSG